MNTTTTAQATVTDTRTAQKMPTYTLYFPLSNGGRRVLATRVTKSAAWGVAQALKAEGWPTIRITREAA